MNEHEPLEESTTFEVVRWRQGGAGPDTILLATEVPLTIVANGQEVATLSCTPGNERELVLGFLFTQGMIQGARDVSEVVVDRSRWRADAVIAVTPDAELLGRRLYTSGCGKGVMYTTVFELGARKPLESDFRVAAASIDGLMAWLRRGSGLHRETRGVHSAALAPLGRPPDAPIDDVGRHNAVDKVIGRALLEGTEMARCVLGGSGRISSEILFKARRAGIPVVACFGAPTHQAVLLARDMGVTLVGFARGSKLTVFSHFERIVA